MNTDQYGLAPAGNRVADGVRDIIAEGGPEGRYLAEALNAVTPVEELGLSTSATNCLRRSGIDTIAQLVALSPDEVLDIRNMGGRSLREIQDALAAVKLTLTDPPPNWVPPYQMRADLGLAPARAEDGAVAS